MHKTNVSLRHILVVKPMLAYVLGLRYDGRGHMLVLCTRPLEITNFPDQVKLAARPLRLLYSYIPVLVFLSEKTLRSLSAYLGSSYFPAHFNPPPPNRVPRKGGRFIKKNPHWSEDLQIVQNLGNKFLMQFLN